MFSPAPSPGTPPDRPSRRSNDRSLPGIAGIGLILTGVAGVIHASAFETGLGLLAAAVAFGVVFFVAFK